MSPAEGADGVGRGGPGPISVVLELCFQQHRCHWARVAGERAGVAWAEPLPPPPRPQGGFRALQGLRPCQCGGTREPLGQGAVRGAEGGVCAAAHLPPPQVPAPAPPHCSLTRLLASHLPRSCVPRPTSPPPRQECSSALSSRPPQGKGIRGKRVLHLAAAACSLPEGYVGLPGRVAPPALLAPAQAPRQALAPGVAQRPSTAAAAGLRLSRTRNLPSSRLPGFQATPHPHSPKGSLGEGHLGWPQQNRLRTQETQGT